jgi:hypothetical protein
MVLIRRLQEKISRILWAPFFGGHVAGSFPVNNEANAVRRAVEWTLSNGFVSKDIDAINNYSTTAIGDLIMRSY